MGCGGASKQRITAPEIERQLQVEGETGIKTEERGSVVPLLPLAEIPRPADPLPPQPLDLGKSSMSPSISDVSPDVHYTRSFSSLKPQSPFRAIPTDSALSDLSKPPTPPRSVQAEGGLQVFPTPLAQIDAVLQTSTPDDSLTEAIPVSAHVKARQPPSPILPAPAEPEELQEMVLGSFRAGQISPSVPKPGKLELSSPNSVREADSAEREKKFVVQPIPIPAEMDDKLPEEVLRSAKVALPSPPLEKPGKLELSSPKKPLEASLDPSDIQREFGIITEHPRNLDRSESLQQAALIGTVDSSRKAAIS